MQLLYYTKYKHNTIQFVKRNTFKTGFGKGATPTTNKELLHVLAFKKFVAFLLFYDNVVKISHKIEKLLKTE